MQVSIDLDCHAPRQPGEFASNPLHFRPSCKVVNRCEADKSDKKCHRRGEDTLNPRSHPVKSYGSEVHLLRVLGYRRDFTQKETKTDVATKLTPNAAGWT